MNPQQPPAFGPPVTNWLAPAPYAGQPRRHPWEIPMLVLVILVGVGGYLLGVVMVSLGYLDTWFILILVAPLLIYLIRGLTYAMPRVNGVKMSPTQFPEGHQMVVEAARRFGLEQVPDAYVVLGNGTINAYASGHGFRRFVVVYSDLFEIGGQARSPEALRFIIGHEVGHIAAGHVSYWRQLGSVVGMNIPVLGQALSRSMEYTADNHGYYHQPSGSPGAIGVLAAGKYMLTSVSFDEFADRATHEKGFFTWVTNLQASHPVLTWRAAALRDRTGAGRMFFRPKNIVRGIGSGHVQKLAPIGSPPQFGGLVAPGHPPYHPPQQAAPRTPPGPPVDLRKPETDRDGDQGV
ncbi:M48 family metallopeptidase [Williamsia sp. 1138]|uniref:M48 family metallopeptidase n=1 Tax=Williamsia sp. 1138 TaxID=1903117 RepID=UPI000A10AA66|nr:M48 family metallopeptidase [Williamsia sp. 1138]